MMKITKIEIKNFKSIKHIEFDIKKYGDSYTTMLVGLNESGKSNILEAMALLAEMTENEDNVCNYNDFKNKKNENNDYVDIYFYLEFGSQSSYLKTIQNKIKNGNLLEFKITDLNQNFYLDDEDNVFRYQYNYEIKISKASFFIENDDGSITLNENKLEGYHELTNETIKHYFKETIEQLISRYVPSCSVWKYSEKYLISNPQELKEFKDDINSNTPLRNIFYLSDYDKTEKIQKIIDDALNDDRIRMNLEDTLGDNATKYIKEKWDHNIDISTRITESGRLTVLVKDNGENNKYDYFYMNDRSDGFKQFISLILSLSIETDKLDQNNRLILIDEPEIHLHPSGIRDLRDELIKIGKENYVFVSTHSPFLIDKRHQERNIIIKKNDNMCTEIRKIQEYENMLDDEVLEDAFGIDVYKDLMNPHRLLVEGGDDKLILQKALKIKKIDGYGILSGNGSNIDIVAKKFNDNNISLLVIVDDDKAGQGYKNKIINIGNSYSQENVFTIKDLIDNISIADGTIEDTLSKEYIESKFKEFYKKYKNQEAFDIDLDENQPFIKQIKTSLLKDNNDKNINDFIEKFKIHIAQEFKPTAKSMANNFPLLNKLVDEIKNKCENK